MPKSSSFCEVYSSQVEWQGQGRSVMIKSLSSEWYGKSSVWGLCFLMRTEINTSLNLALNFPIQWAVAFPKENSGTARISTDKKWHCIASILIRKLFLLRDLYNPVFNSTSTSLLFHFKLPIPSNSYLQCNFCQFLQWGYQAVCAFHLIMRSVPWKSPFFLITPWHLIYRILWLPISGFNFFFISPIKLTDWISSLLKAVCSLDL